MATLKVTVHEARDLPVMDSGTGQADPYVVLKLDDMEHTTEIVRHTRYPVWNRDYRFDTPDLLILQEDPLVVRVYDHDILSRDDLVGMVILDCNCILGLENPTLNGWFPLHDTIEGLRGDIRLTIRIKFHAAENPLRPALPERYIYRVHLAQPEQDPATKDLPRIQSNAKKGTDSDISFNKLTKTEWLTRGLEKGIPTSSAGIDRDGIGQMTSVVPLRTRMLKRNFSNGWCQAKSKPPILFLNQGLDPLTTTQSPHPTLAVEEESVFFFSAWRLDPAVYRVESMQSMVEELIVKADPEHSRLTNLRSLRATNEARLSQLFKLSGKVRRQLGRKVVELRCNAVLGYVEEFDIELKDIIVRAYGTPCVISLVSFVDKVNLQNLNIRCQNPTTALTPSSLIGPLTMEANTFLPLSLFPLAPDEGKRMGSTPASTLMKPIKQSTAQYPPLSPELRPKQTDQSPNLGLVNEAVKVSNSHAKSCAFSLSLPSTTNKSCFLSGTALVAAPSTAALEAPAKARSDSNSTHLSSQSKPGVTATRTAITVLSVKDIPSGCILHIGGHICSRSVKIISRGHSRLAISQERDAWWMELREELRTNARAFHCNAILGYEEETQCCEDVILLSLFGTAVVLDTSFLSLRAEHTYLFQKACERIENKRTCSMLHRQRGLHRKVLNFKRNSSGHHADSMLCRICKRKPIPEVILASCSLPVDLVVAGRMQLVQATVVKSKNDVRGVRLAMEVSQALPYMEFALHKQLLFNLRLLRMNACFGLRVSIVIGPRCITGILTGTACRLAALPIPSPPQMKITNPMIVDNERVIRLKDLIQRNRRLYSYAKGLNAKKHPHRRHRASPRRDDSSSSSPRLSASKKEAGGSCRGTPVSKSLHSYSFSSSSYSSESVRKKRCGSHSTTSSRPTPPLSVLNHKHSSESSTSGTTTPSSSMSSSTEREIFCIEASDSDSDDTEDLHRPAAEVQALGLVGSRVNDFVIKIDDEEEADMMLGIDSTTAFEDSILLTVPYLPEQVNWFDTQECVTVHRRYAFDELTPRLLNECCADAKRVFVVATTSHVWEQGTLSTDDEAYWRTAQALGERRAINGPTFSLPPTIIRVFDFKIQFLFEPNLGDLHLRLEGCVVTNRTSLAPTKKACDAWANLLQLEDQAFCECLRHSNVGLLSKSYAHDGKEEDSMIAAIAPSTAVLRRLAATFVDRGRSSAAFEDVSEKANSTTSPAGGAVDTQELSAQQNVASRPRCTGVVDRNTKIPDKRNHEKRHPTHDCANINQPHLLYALYRQVFATCNAPFNLTYMLNSYRCEVPPLRVWAPGTNDGPTAGGVSTSGASRTEIDGSAHSKYNVTTYTDYRKRKPTRSNTVVGRWQSLWSATKSSLHGVIERTKQAANFSPHYTGNYHNSKNNRFSKSHNTGSDQGSAKIEAPATHYHKPMEHLPPDLSTLHELIFTVLCTPLDFVPGKVIVRYLGRLSQHYIRQAKDINRGAQLGSFYQHVEFEIRCLVQSLVSVMGGNAVLKYRVVYHEMNDSDGSRSALVLVSVTGDVVQVIPATDLVNSVDEKEPSLQNVDGNDPP